MSPSSNKRWCPTPEQIMILEELYRRGLKTPSAAQIQRITAHPSFYGKIQGKNVFYWFQNHKARDRQKLRKKLIKQLHQQHLLQQHQYQYQLHSQTQSTHTALDYHQLQASPFQKLPNCHSSQNLLHAQGTSAGVCYEEATEGLMTQSWRGELATELLMRSNGPDLTMIMDVGPTFPCWIRNKPLQTLELFPIRPPSATTDDQNYTNRPVI
ncbi:hypothetical protein OROGR_019808 [Orobanche gracilis]